MEDDDAEEEEEDYEEEDEEDYEEEDDFDELDYSSMPIAPRGTKSAASTSRASAKSAKSVKSAKSAQSARTTKSVTSTRSGAHSSKNARSAKSGTVSSRASTVVRNGRDSSASHVGDGAKSNPERSHKNSASQRGTVPRGSQLAVPTADAVSSFRPLTMHKGTRTSVAMSAWDSASSVHDGAQSSGARSRRTSKSQRGTVTRGSHLAVPTADGATSFKPASTRTPPAAVSSVEELRSVVSGLQQMRDRHGSMVVLDTDGAKDKREFDKLELSDWFSTETAKYLKQEGMVVPPSTMYPPKDAQELDKDIKKLAQSVFGLKRDIALMQQCLTNGRHLVTEAEHRGDRLIRPVHVTSTVLEKSSKKEIAEIIRGMEALCTLKDYEIKRLIDAMRPFSWLYDKAANKFGLLKDEIEGLMKQVAALRKRGKRGPAILPDSEDDAISGMMSPGAKQASFTRPLTAAERKACAFSHTPELDGRERHIHDAIAALDAKYRTRDDTEFGQTQFHAEYQHGWNGEEPPLAVIKSTKGAKKLPSHVSEEYNAREWQERYGVVSSPPNSPPPQHVPDAPSSLVRSAREEDKGEWSSSSVGQVKSAKPSPRIMPLFMAGREHVSPIPVAANGIGPVPRPLHSPRLNALTPPTGRGLQSPHDSPQPHEQSDTFSTTVASQQGFIDHTSQGVGTEGVASGVRSVALQRIAGTVDRSPVSEHARHTAFSSRQSGRMSDYGGISMQPQAVAGQEAQARTSGYTTPTDYRGPLIKPQAVANQKGHAQTPCYTDDRGPPTAADHASEARCAVPGKSQTLQGNANGRTVSPFDMKGKASWMGPPFGAYGKEGKAAIGFKGPVECKGKYDAWWKGKTKGAWCLPSYGWKGPWVSHKGKDAQPYTHGFAQPEIPQFGTMFGGKPECNWKGGKGTPLCGAKGSNNWAPAALMKNGKGKHGWNVAYSPRDMIAKGDRDMHGWGVAYSPHDKMTKGDQGKHGWDIAYSPRDMITKGSQGKHGWGVASSPRDMITKGGQGKQPCRLVGTPRGGTKLVFPDQEVGRDHLMRGKPVGGSVKGDDYHAEFRITPRSYAHSSQSPPRTLQHTPQHSPPAGSSREPLRVSAQMMTDTPRHSMGIMTGTYRVSAGMMTDTRAFSSEVLAESHPVSRDTNMLDHSASAGVMAGDRHASSRVSAGGHFAPGNAMVSTGVMTDVPVTSSSVMTDTTYTSAGVMTDALVTASGVMTDGPPTSITQRQSACTMTTSVMRTSQGMQSSLPASSRCSEGPSSSNNSSRTPASEPVEAWPPQISTGKRQTTAVPQIVLPHVPLRSSVDTSVVLEDKDAKDSSPRRQQQSTTWETDPEAAFDDRAFSPSSPGNRPPSQHHLSVPGSPHVDLRDGFHGNSPRVAPLRPKQDDLLHNEYVSKSSPRKMLATPSARRPILSRLAAVDTGSGASLRFSGGESSLLQDRLSERSPLFGRSGSRLASAAYGKSGPSGAWHGASFMSGRYGGRTSPRAPFGGSPSAAETTRHVLEHSGSRVGSPKVEHTSTSSPNISSPTNFQRSPRIAYPRQFHVTRQESPPCSHHHHHRVHHVLHHHEQFSVSESPTNALVHNHSRALQFAAAPVASMSAHRMLPGNAGGVPCTTSRMELGIEPSHSIHATAVPPCVLRPAHRPQDIPRKKPNTLAAMHHSTHTPTPRLASSPVIPQSTPQWGTSMAPCAGPSSPSLCPASPLLHGTCSTQPATPSPFNSPQQFSMSPSNVAQQRGRDDPRPNSFGRVVGSPQSLGGVPRIGHPDSQLSAPQGCANAGIGGRRDIPHSTTLRDDIPERPAFGHATRSAPLSGKPNENEVVLAAPSRPLAGILRNNNKAGGNRGASPGMRRVSCTGPADASSGTKPSASDMEQLRALLQCAQMCQDGNGFKNGALAGVLSTIFLQAARYFPVEQRDMKVEQVRADDPPSWLLCRVNNLLSQNFLSSNIPLALLRARRLLQVM